MLLRNCDWLDAVYFSEHRVVFQNLLFWDKDAVNWIPHNIDSLLVAQTQRNFHNAASWGGLAVYYSRLSKNHSPVASSVSLYNHLMAVLFPSLPAVNWAYSLSNTPILNCQARRPWTTSRHGWHTLVVSKASWAVAGRLEQEQFPCDWRTWCHPSHADWIIRPHI